MNKLITNKKKSKTSKKSKTKVLDRELTPFEEYKLSLDEDKVANIGADGMWQNLKTESMAETKANFGKDTGFSNKMGAATDIIGGIGDIANATAANAKIKDTTEDRNNIEQFGNTMYSATNFTDALSQFNNRGELKQYDKKDLTGSAGEKAKNMGKATLSGAKAGAKFGPIGAIIGGAVGAISSGIGWAVGDNKAKKEAERLNHMSMLADARNASNFDINTDNIAYQSNMMDMANYAAYGGRFNRFDDGSFMPKLDKASLEDVINTESSFSGDEKIELPYESKYIGLINPFTGGYANLNIQAYDKLNEGNGKYETPIHIRRNANKEKNLEEVNKGFKFIHDWYSNSRRQAIKSQNDLEIMLIDRDNSVERAENYPEKIAESIENGNKKLTRELKKERNKNNKHIKSLNKEILKHVSNPNKTIKKTNEELKNSIQRVINLPVSIYDPESGESNVYYDYREVQPNFYYIDNKDGYKYTPSIVGQKTLDDGSKVDIAEITNAYYNSNNKKGKRFLSFNKKRAFKPNKISSVGEEVQHAMELKSSELLARNIVNGITKYDPGYTFDPYYDKDTEILGKLGNLRKELNVDPNKEYSLKEIKEMKKNYEGDNHIMNNYPPEIITLLFNKLKDGGPLFNEFTDGISIINEGGTHEENPYEGVQVGVDPEGVPNLVEEGEVIWNDYVFSDRLKVPDAVRHKYKLRGNKETTFADSAKEIQKMSEEMPNDPIVKRTMEYKMAELMREQEAVRMRKNKNKNNSIAHFAAFGGNIFSGGGNWRNDTSEKGYYDESTGQYNAPATQDALNALYNQWYTEDPEDFTRFRTELAQKEKEARVANNWKIVNDYIANSGKYNAMNSSILGYDASRSHLWGPSTAARLGVLNWAPLETVVTPDPEPVVKQEPEGSAVTPEEETSAPGDPSDDDKPKLGLDRILNAANAGFDVLSGYLDRFTTKPDYSHYDSLRNAINRANVRVSSNPVVSNLKYKPSDTQGIYNRMQATNAANVRNIMNTSGGNSAIARASLLTNDYNFNNSLGSLWRQAEESEYNRRMAYDKYKTDIAAANDARAMQAASTNANILSNQAGLWKQYADARQNIDNITSAALSANYNTAKQSLQGYAQQLWGEGHIDNAIKNGYLIDDATGKRYSVSPEADKTPTEGNKYGGKIKRNNKKKRRLS